MTVSQYFPLPWGISSEELEKVKMALRDIIVDNPILLAQQRQDDRLTINVEIIFIGQYNQYTAATVKGDGIC